MKEIFDSLSHKVSKFVTHKYSTSFSISLYLMPKQVRQDIYAIYGFARIGDEIVDSFTDYNRKEVLNMFITSYEHALKYNISPNPILNSFQKVVHKYKLQDSAKSFLKSMEMDTSEIDYTDQESFKNYIHGSANVIGLMCLKVFVKNDEKKYEELKPYAIKLGSAFQKINFLRDYKDDTGLLGRSYFPNISGDIDEKTKNEIVEDMSLDFKYAFIGIKKLPYDCRLGVLLAYKYYEKVLNKMEKSSYEKIKQQRIRIPNHHKITILIKMFIQYKLKLL